MASISVSKIPAFDAEKERKISFVYSGNQCIANTITVYNSSTNASVYSHRVTSFALSHTIPAGTLTNGVSYYIKITAHYMNGSTEESVTSVASNIFLCLKTPTWEFSGITNNSTVNNSTVNLTMVYSQAQNEEINEFIIEVYTVGHTVFHRSPSLYDASAAYTVSGLEDNSVYYLRAYGSTVNGLIIDTRDEYPDDIKITADFIAPDVYSLTYLENVPDKGVIRISLNVASIEGHSQSGTDFTYTDDDYVNLQNDYVVFDQNVYAGGEFTFLIKGKNFTPNRNIFSLTSADGNDTVTVDLYQATISGATKYYACLKHQNKNSPIVYSICTDFMDIDLTSDIQILIQHSGGLYSLTMEVMS